MPAPIAPEQIAALAAASQLDLPPPLLRELASAYEHVRRMTDRLPRDWQYGDEPAHVFDGRAYTPRDR